MDFWGKHSPGHYIREEFERQASAYPNDNASLYTSNGVRVCGLVRDGATANIKFLANGLNYNTEIGFTTHGI